MKYLWLVILHKTSLIKIPKQSKRFFNILKAFKIEKLNITEKKTLYSRIFR